MGTIAAREPVIWWIAGYPFAAGPLVVCIMAVIITRVVIGLQAQTKGQLALDVAVMLLCTLVTVLWVQSRGLDLFPAGITGIGIGTTGAGILAFAKTETLGRLKEAVKVFTGKEGS